MYDEIYISKRTLKKNMSFIESIKTVFFHKYANFNGRASRSEYWWSGLAYIVPLIFLNFLSEILFWIFWILTVIPLYAVCFRRLHDTNRSGWNAIINVGLWIITLLLLFLTVFSGFAFIMDNPALLEPASDSEIFNFSEESMEGVGALGIAFFAYVLFALAAFSHSVYLIVVLIIKGDESDNRFGSNPLLGECLEVQIQEVNDQSDDTNLNSLTVKQLKDLAVEKGVHILSKDTKAVIIQKLSE